MTAGASGGLGDATSRLDAQDRAVLEHLLPSCDRRHLLDLRVKRNGHMRTTFLDNLASVVARAERESPTGDVYFGVAARAPGGGRGKRNLAYTAALWADVDSKCFPGGRSTALAAIRSFEVKPSAVVDSGNGFHVYWLLTEPLALVDEQERERAEGIMRGLQRRLPAEAGTALDSTWDVSRILRVPGTWNHKHAVPVRVTTVEAHFERRYSIAELMPYHDGRSLPKSRRCTRSEAWQTTLEPWAGRGAEALQLAVDRGISQNVLRLIRTGNATAYGRDRSRRDQAVVLALRAAGTEADDVLAIFADYPVGAKANEPGNGEQYVRRSIEKADERLASGASGRRTLGALPPDVREEVSLNSGLRRLQRLNRAFPATVAEATSKLGWERKTIVKHLRRGLALGWFELAGEQRAARGRPARLYRSVRPPLGSEGAWVRYMYERQALRASLRTERGTAPPLDQADH